MARSQGMNPLLKYGLLAGAGYVGWQVIKSKVGGLVPPDTTTIAPVVTSSNAPPPPPPAPPSTPAQLQASERDLGRASMNLSWASDAKGTALTIDEWNHFRGLYQRDVIHNPEWNTNPDYHPALDAFVDPAHRFDRISAEAYHGLLHKAGLEGLGAGIVRRTWNISGRGVY